MTRARPAPKIVLSLLALLLLAASCSGNDPELIVDASPMTTTSVVTGSAAGSGSSVPPTETTGAPEGSAIEGSVDAERPARTQAVYTDADGAWEIDGEDRRFLDAVDGEVPQAYWVGLERELVLLTSTELQVHGGGEVLTASCDSCQGIAAISGQLYTMNDARQILSFDPSSLDATIVADEIPAAEVDFASFGSVIAATETEIVVLIADPRGPSAYGGPQELWAVAPATGASRLITELPYNSPIHGWQMNAFGTDLVFAGAGYRAGACDHFELVTTLDLATGVITELPGLIDPGELPGGSAVFTYDAFWNGNTVYAIFEVLWSNADVCDVQIPTALYRFDDDGQRWERVDAGPLNQVRPIGPADGQKLVTLRGNEVYDEDGDGVAELLTDQGFVSNSIATADEVGLAPPGRPVTSPSIEVLPGGSLVGVPLNTDADEAIDRLLTTFGPVDVDTGWNAGCPLDGDTFADERLLRWGVVSAIFNRTSEDDPGRFTVWFVSEGGSGTIGADQIHLPGAIELGDPLSDAVTAYGTDPIDIGFLQLLDLGGMTLAAETLDDPIRDVGVPFVPICD